VWKEPDVVGQAVDFYDRHLSNLSAHDGFFLQLGDMITGAGWIDAGPGYRRHFLANRAVMTASAAISWRLYTMAQATVEFPGLAGKRLSLGAQTLYQDSLQVNYFGLGNDSPKADRSGYRLRTTDIVGFGRLRLGMLNVRGRAGWLPSIDVASMGGRTPSYPDTDTQFTDVTAPGLTHQPSFVHADVTVSADTRNNGGFPVRGGTYRASAARYADLDGGTNSFGLYEIEAAQYTPVLSEKWVLAIHGEGVFSSPSNGGDVPFYLLPNVGGNTTLRGYADYRFTDRNMEVFSLESRWRVLTHVDVAIFADAGKVAHTAGKLGFSDLKTSYGAGIRLHDAHAMIGRMEVAHSAEGWRAVFKIAEPFRRKTVFGDWAPVIPFAP
jgi:outer membrane protein assembly factor BamA